MSGTRSCPSQQGSRPGAKADDRYEVAVLMRLSENEGWFEEIFTEALKELAERKKNNITAPAQEPTSTVNTTPHQSQNRLINIEKRQETVRITRQADNEGWSDEKMLAALRLRNSVHYELREKRKSTPSD